MDRGGAYIPSIRGCTMTPHGRYTVIHADARGDVRAMYAYSRGILHVLHVLVSHAEKSAALSAGLDYRLS